MNRKLRSNLYLVCAAFIWGNGFIAQSVGMEHVGPWTFTCLRNCIAAITLFVLYQLKKNVVPTTYERNSKKEWMGGIACGVALCAASMLQQTGLLYTTVSKAGFITALYTILVPIFSVLLGKSISKNIWVSVCIAMLGLYFLNGAVTFSVGLGETLEFLCAIGFAIHILVIDHFGKGIDGFIVSGIQFLVAGILCIVPMILLETPTFDLIFNAGIAIGYAGVFSSGIAYTLQILGQKHTSPTIACMLLALEGVFASVSGYFLLHQSLTIFEILGCMFIFVAIIIAQLPNNESAIVESNESLK